MSSFIFLPTAILGIELFLLVSIQIIALIKALHRCILSTYIPVPRYLARLISFTMSTTSTAQISLLQDKDRIVRIDIFIFYTSNLQ